MSTKKTGVTPSYLHGFSAEEQARLYRQARFLEDSVYRQVDFSAAKNLIEVGCGVGAQTEILLERFPHLQISGVDASEAQLKTAKAHLVKSPNANRVKFFQGDALHLDFKDNTFDAAFLCWILEHVQEPVEILKEVNRVLREQGEIICTEVLNSNFYVHPYSPATLKYWFEMNDHQWNIKGDPFVGGKLANYLLKAGFQNIKTKVVTQHFDNRTPKKRSQFISFFIDLLLSAAPSLLEIGKITPELVEEMKEELERLKHDPDSVIFLSFIQAHAQAL